MRENKAFVFLYPIPQIIDWEIENNKNSFGNNEKTFGKVYERTINQCIDLRYRKRGFNINYAIFDDCIVSDIININLNDRIIKVGLNFDMHTSKKEYPDQDFILNQLGDIDTLRVAGFHMWDCVEKLAKRAHERKLNTLIDEDLTEFFPSRINDESFRVEIYPTFNPYTTKTLDREWFVKAFLEARKGKQWLWQNY